MYKELKRIQMEVAMVYSEIVAQQLLGETEESRARYRGTARMIQNGCLFGCVTLEACSDGGAALAAVLPVSRSTSPLQACDHQDCT